MFRQDVKDWFLNQAQILIARGEVPKKEFMLETCKVKSLSEINGIENSYTKPTPGKFTIHSIQIDLETNEWCVMIQFFHSGHCYRFMIQDTIENWQKIK